jgi:hypothetical protein
MGRNHLSQGRLTGDGTPGQRLAVLGAADPPRRVRHFFSDLALFRDGCGFVSTGQFWTVSRTRLRSGSPARPNIWRLIILM